VALEVLIESKRPDGIVPIVEYLAWCPKVFRNILDRLVAFEVSTELKRPEGMVPVVE